jgi:hypothetical protein
MAVSRLPGVEGRGAREVQKAVRRAEQDVDEWGDPEASEPEAS